MQLTPKYAKSRRFVSVEGKFPLLLSTEQFYSTIYSIDIVLFPKYPSRTCT